MGEPLVGDRMEQRIAVESGDAAPIALPDLASAIRRGPPLAGCFWPSRAENGIWTNGGGTARGTSRWPHTEVGIRQALTFDLIRRQYLHGVRRYPPKAILGTAYEFATAAAPPGLVRAYL